MKSFRLFLLSMLILSHLGFNSLGAPTGKSPAATSGKTNSKLSEEQKKKNIESFEFVWTTIRDKHWDPDLNGLDWQAIRKEFLPMVENADSQGKVRALLSSMLKRLNQSHFAIIPGEVYQEISPEKKSDGEEEGDAYPGFSVRVVGGKALVFQVEKGTPADKMGIHPGWEILEIKGIDLAPILEKVTKTFKKSHRLERELYTAVMKRLHGAQGAKLPILFLDGENKKKELKVTLVDPQGVPVTFGNLPTLHVHYDFKILPGNIVYFSLSTFADTVRVMQAFEKAVTENLDAKGFIIDLRGNPGGIGLMAVGMSNWFIDQPKAKLGTMISRNGKLNFLLNRRIKTYKGPLAILVDGLSGSTSEILAGGLQDLKRAHVFGTTSAAAALPSVFERLPNGDGFQYAMANYISVGGKALEGRGVHPDEVVPLSRDALLSGHDPVIDAACQWIRKKK